MRRGGRRMRRRRQEVVTEQRGFWKGYYSTDKLGKSTRDSKGQQPINSFQARNTKPYDCELRRKCSKIDYEKKSFFEKRRNAGTKTLERSISKKSNKKSNKRI
jgi:hypothetical protein